jgi:hypothetical protein
VNDTLKVVLIKWRIPSAVAKAPPIDLTAQIEKRAYDLYEKRGRQDGQAGEDWAQAEQEIRKDDSHK